MLHLVAATLATLKPPAASRQVPPRDGNRNRVRAKWSRANENQVERDPAPAGPGSIQAVTIGLGMDKIFYNLYKTR
ncbi:MAG: hypothetical protein KDK91_15475 [Gammaproteobacteria bacterium]|nr:hypothetical protein [Gammaproteobacteria bacterium]